MNINCTFTVLATGLTATAISGNVAASETELFGTDTVYEQKTGAISHHFFSGCHMPANRDYHSILEMAETTSEGEFKFSGCGGAI